MSDAAQQKAQLVARIQLENWCVLRGRYGPEASDAVLKHAVDWLRRNFSQDALIGRIEADELCVAIARPDGDPIDTLRALHESLEAELRLASPVMPLGVRIGAAITDEDSTPHAQALHHAQLALHLATRTQKAVQLYDNSVIAYWKRKIENETRLLGAVKRSELVLYLQPKVVVATGVIDGVEALVRWPQKMVKSEMPLNFSMQTCRVQCFYYSTIGFVNKPWCCCARGRNLPAAICASRSISAPSKITNIGLRLGYSHCPRNYADD
jgi:predicted signal transduction protein with EAL and GGDEF domain